jgi:ankyrin repeat protein
MPKWTFPDLEGPSVFIGSPGDVEDLREAARQEFDRLAREAGDLHGASLYLWEEKTRLGDFSQDRPYQASIPLPRGNGCSAIFIFGERIGSPLPFDFDAAELDGTPAANPLSPHPLIRAWRGDAPGKGFPLTGSTFEYLVAEIAQTPRLVLFYGDETLRDGRHVFEQNWGLNRLRESKAPLPYTERRQWEDEQGIPQREALRNFFRYTSEDRTYPLHIVSNEGQVRERIRAFLADRLGLDRSAHAVPFRGLAPYQLEDNSVFFGRNTVRDEIVAMIGDRIDNPRPDRRPFVGISGASGSGKSSLMRAGVVAHLSHWVSLGNWVPHISRAGDLAVQVSAPEDDALVPLAADCIASIAGPGARQAAANQLSERIPQYRPAQAVESIIAALDRRSAAERKRPWRLILGIDQFEECLEDLARPADSLRWDNLIAFLDQATATGRIAVVYTIPLSRLTQMNQHRVLRQLSLAGAEKRVGFPTETVGQIIDRSFAQVNAELSPGLRDKLLSSIEELSSSARGEDQGPVLPLLSLAMSRIYERWQSQLRTKREEWEAREAVVSLSTQFEAADVREDGQPAADRTLSLEPYKELAELASVIDQEGNAAIDDAKKAARGAFIDDETLPILLRSLVRLAAGVAGRFDLQTIPPPPDPVVSLLAGSLRRHRLIAENKDGLLRLVHEAVLLHWKAAAGWLEKETYRLDYVSGLARAINTWEKSGRSPDVIAALGVYDREGAAEVLYAWASTLAPAASHHPIADDRYEELRAFLVAVLRFQNTPAAPIPKLETGPTHFHAAVAIGAVELVREFLGADRKYALLARTKDNRTALFDAAFLDRLEILQSLLDAGAPPDAPDKDGWLPLHAAATRGNIRAVTTLAKVTADVDAGGGPGRSAALNIAAGNGHTAAVRVLLDHAAAIDRADSNGWTALHTAAIGGHTETVSLLLDRGAALQPVLDFGWTPLHLTAQEGHHDVAAVLLARGAAVEAPLSNKSTPLHVAAQHGHDRVAAMLLARGAPADAEAYNEWRTDAQRAQDTTNPGWMNPGWTPLHVAAQNGREAVSRVLLEHGAGANVPNGQGKTPFHIAVENGHMGVVQVLLAHDATTVNQRDRQERTPLQVALESAKYPLAQLLVQHGAQVDAFRVSSPVGMANQWTSLHFAAMAGDLASAQFLLGKGAAAGAINSDGWRPLDLAARHGHEPLARLLLTRGAVVGESPLPLHLAAEYGHRDVAALLIDRGAAVNARDRTRWTALHLAAQHGHAAVVQLLLERGAERDAVSAQPALTPLQAAAETGQEAVVRLLLEHGANLNAVTEDRAQPLLLSVKNGQFATALQLLDGGAAADARDRDGNTAAILFRAARARRLGAGELPDETEIALARRLGVDTAGELPPEPEPAVHEAAGAPIENLGNFLTSPWQLADAESISSLIPRITSAYAKYPLDDSRTRIWWSRLSFYGPGVRLIRVRNPQWKDEKLFLYLLLHGAETYPLTGASPPLHELNGKAPLRLTENNVLDYLRFFCFFVRSQEGPFYVLENDLDPLIPDHPVVRQAVAGTLRPASFEGFNPQGDFLCDAVIYYSNAIFLANFAVEPSGMVRMLDDEPIAADLPAKIHAPIA